MSNPFPRDPEAPYNVVQVFGRYHKDWKFVRATDPEDAWERAQEMYLETRDERREKGEHPEDYDTRFYGMTSHGVHIYGPNHYYRFYNESHWRTVRGLAKRELGEELTRQEAALVSGYDLQQSRGLQPW